ncbi:MAG: DUF2911 domain-containing protein [Bacteroidota bacterium]
MKKTIVTLSLVVAAYFAQTTSASAQLQLPQPSPKAKLVQTAGLTDITIDYSSPAVKGRTIWGDLVPYNEVWRAGANKATSVNFSKDVVIKSELLVNGDLISKDVTVPAGSYSLFYIPGKVMWTVILNKNTELWGSDGYKQEEDVVRTSVKAETISNRERMTFIVSNSTDDAANIDLEWEKVRVSLPIKLGTAKQATENINKTLGGTWRSYASAARYMYETPKDYDAALKYIDLSLALTQDWYNTWYKAKIVAAKGMTKEAHALAVKAKELGDKNPDNFFYKDDVEAAIKEWAVAPAKKK